MIIYRLVNKFRQSIQHTRTNVTIYKLYTHSIYNNSSNSGSSSSDTIMYVVTFADRCSYSHTFTVHYYYYYLRDYGSLRHWGI